MCHFVVYWRFFCVFLFLFVLKSLLAWTSKFRQTQKQKHVLSPHNHFQAKLKFTQLWQPVQDLAEWKIQKKKVNINFQRVKLCNHLCEQTSWITINKAWPDLFKSLHFVLFLCFFFYFLCKINLVLFVVCSKKMFVRLDKETHKITQNTMQKKMLTASID